jgi:hypothetical protein
VNLFRKRGLLPTDPERKIGRQPALEHLKIAGALKTLSTSADLTSFAPKVLNQGNSETCWAHSASTLLFTRRGFLGEIPVLQSPLYFAQCMYATYRASNNPGALPPLQDQGAQLDDAAKCFARWGSVRFGTPQQDGETDVPATADTSGNPLPLPELTIPAVETGATAPFGGPYDISPNDSAIETVCASIQAGNPVWIGALVGEAFQAIQAGEVAEPCPTDDPTAGGHAMSLLGFRTVSGALQVLCRNSWGASWGSGGNVWLSPAFIASAWSLLPFEVAS